MNKNFRVIKINGIRGILTALFVLGCAIAGFLIFPGWICMHLWNYTSSFFTAMPQMNLVHGAILWAIIALTVYALNNSRSLIGFSSQPTLNEEQIKEIMSRVKNGTNTIRTIHPDCTEEQKQEVKTDSIDEIRK